MNWYRFFLHPSPIAETPQDDVYWKNKVTAGIKDTLNSERLMTDNGVGVDDVSEKSCSTSAWTFTLTLYATENIFSPISEHESQETIIIAL